MNPYSKKNIVWTIIKAAQYCDATVTAYPKKKGEPLVVEVKTKRPHRKNKKARFIEVYIHKDYVSIQDVNAGIKLEDFAYTETEFTQFLARLDELLSNKTSDNQPTEA